MINEHEDEFAVDLSEEQASEGAVAEDLPELPHSPEARAILAEFELGIRLELTTNTPGWQDILDIIEQEVLRNENELLAYNGPNSSHIVALQRHAHAQRALFTFLQRRVHELIQSSHQLQKPR